MSLRYLMSALALVALCGISAQQPVKPAALRFPTIERRYDAVVLVADARTGSLLGGVRVSEGHDRRYHPASLFKLPIALAALSSGKYSSTYTYTCDGTDTIGRRRYECWRRDGHGRLDFRLGVAHSCNLYFRSLAEGLSRTQIVQAARVLGMLPSESAADRLSLSDETLLGESWNLSPNDLLTSAVALASRGRISPERVALPYSRYRAMYDGLAACVSKGTGSEGRSRRFTMAGKTGTAEMPEELHATIGWFIGYAPASAPKYAICVMARRSRGSDAARIARLALEELL